MSNPQTHNKIERLLSYYFAAGVFEGIISFLYVSLIPSDPKNAWLFGYSQSRFILMAILLGVILFFVFTWRKFKLNDNFRNAIQNRVDQELDILGYFLPIIVIMLGLVGFGSYLPFFFSYTRFDLLYANLFRILPFFVYGLVRSFDLGVVLWIARSAQKGKKRPQPQQITISSKKIRFISISIAAVLILISGLLDLISVIKEKRVWKEVYPLFNLAAEENIPTFYSTTLLILSSILLYFIAFHKRKDGDRFSSQWTFLSFLFFILALDETSSIHSQFIPNIRVFFNSSGIFYFAWVIIAIPMVALLGLYLYKFILSLPRSTRLNFFISAILF